MMTSPTVRSRAGVAGRTVTTIGFEGVC
jgi:hypothetical protein